MQAVDGSTPDVLLRKVGLLRDQEAPPLAGRMTGLLNLAPQLPDALWYDPDDQAHDQRFWPRILDALTAGTLLIFDLRKYRSANTSYWTCGTSFPRTKMTCA